MPFVPLRFHKGLMISHMTSEDAYRSFHKQGVVMEKVEVWTSNRAVINMVDSQDFSSLMGLPAESLAQDASARCSPLHSCVSSLRHHHHGLLGLLCVECGVWPGGSNTPREGVRTSSLDLAWPCGRPLTLKPSSSLF